MDCDIAVYIKCVDVIHDQIRNWFDGKPTFRKSGTDEHEIAIVFA